jgi:hypothetical protein
VCFFLSHVRPAAQAAAAQSASRPVRAPARVHQLRHTRQGKAMGVYYLVATTMPQPPRLVPRPAATAPFLDRRHRRRRAMCGLVRLCRRLGAFATRRSGYAGWAGLAWLGSRHRAYGV